MTADRGAPAREQHPADMVLDLLRELNRHLYGYAPTTLGPVSEAAYAQAEQLKRDRRYGR